MNEKNDTKTDMLFTLPPEYDTLVLSGGGVKAFCLLGSIQACMDLTILSRIKFYIGTSAGSMIGYLLAIGYTPIEILVSINTNKWFDKVPYFDLVAVINGNGATSFTELQDAFEKMTIDKIGQLLTLGKLRELYGKTFICTTYNTTRCITEYLGPDNYPDMPCITAVRMSCNIPLVFDRFRWKDSFYVDGGMTDNFPILKGLELGNRVLGILLDMPVEALRDDPHDSVLHYVLRLLQVPMVQYMNDRILHAEQQARPNQMTIIKIPVSDSTNPVDFNIKLTTRLDLFSLGYSTTKAYFLVRQQQQTSTVFSPPSQSTTQTITFPPSPSSAASSSIADTSLPIPIAVPDVDLKTTAIQSHQSIDHKNEKQ